jgi:hypothetical protein
VAADGTMRTVAYRHLSGTGAASVLGSRQAVDMQREFRVSAVRGSREQALDTVVPDGGLSNVCPPRGRLRGPAGVRHRVLAGCALAVGLDQ